MRLEPRERLAGRARERNRACLQAREPDLAQLRSVNRRL